MTKVLLDTDKAAVIGAVSGATVTDAGTPASDDKVLIQDTSDSDNLKYVNIADLPGGGVGVLSNVATARIIGRTTEGSGDSEELTAAATRTLLNVEDGATADQTGAQIKTAYEAEANAFTDTKNTKLSGIESGADVTDTANVTAAGALMDSEVTNLAQVKAFDTTDYVTPTGTETVTNKRINKRTSTTTSTTTLTPSPANYDVYTLTAQAAALTIANPTGTPVLGDTIAIYVTDNATARAISFGTQFKGFGAALPTTTTSGKTLLITAQYYDTNMWSVLSAEIQ